MTAFLLDVNVLIALMWPAHESHAQVQDCSAGNRAKDGHLPVDPSGLRKNHYQPCVFTRRRNSPGSSETSRRQPESPSHRFWADEISFVQATQPFARRLAGHQQVTDAYLLGLSCISGAFSRPWIVPSSPCSLKRVPRRLSRSNLTITISRCPTPSPSSPAGPPPALTPNANANLERSPYSGRRHRHKSLGRFWVPHPSVLRVRVLSFPRVRWRTFPLLLLPESINSEQPLFSLRVMRPTAPRPILGCCASLDHRIRMHVLQLFFYLLRTPNIEIVKSPLPERPASAPASGNARDSCPGADLLGFLRSARGKPSVSTPVKSSKGLPFAGSPSSR